jgi:hypothetical protein
MYLLHTLLTSMCIIMFGVGLPRLPPQQVSKGLRNSLLVPLEDMIASFWSSNAHGVTMAKELAAPPEVIQSHSAALVKKGGTCDAGNAVTPGLIACACGKVVVQVLIALWAGCAEELPLAYKGVSVCGFCWVPAAGYPLSPMEAILVATRRQVSRCVRTCVKVCYGRAASTTSQLPGEYTKVANTCFHDVRWFKQELVL